MTNSRELIGVVGVDSGSLLIGDPCYWIDQEVRALYMTDDFFANQHIQANYEAGHSGKGIFSATGWGDGMYEVYATFNSDGRIAKLEVIFIEDEDHDAENRE